MGTTATDRRAAEPAGGRLTAALLGLDRQPDGASRVARALESMPGVVRAYVNSDTEMAYVEYRESEVTPASLMAALEQAGLSVSAVTAHSATPGEPFPAEMEREMGRDMQSTPTEVDLMPDDHSCCEPATSQGATAVEAQARAGSGGASASGLSHAAQARPGWPFRVRLSLYLAAVVLVLGPALWLVRPMSSNVMSADYSVDMSMTGFTPPNFSVPGGKPVSIQLNNVDSPFHGVINGALHQFAIDRLNIDVRLDGKQSTVLDLPALEPGTYEFYCNVCCGGKVNPSMRGTITVEGAEGISQR